MVDDDADCIAVQELVWIERDLPETSLTVRIWRPHRDVRHGTTWRCPVEIDGLQQKLEIGGDGSVQALSLAVSLAYQRLTHLLAKGRLLHPTSRGEFTDETLRALFGR